MERIKIKCRLFGGLFPLLLLVSVLISILRVDNVSAATSITNASGLYAYYINGSATTGASWSGRLPVELLTGGTTTTKRLYGVQYTHNYNDVFSGTYYTNMIKMTIRIQQAYSYEKTINSGVEVSIQAATHNGDSIAGACSVSAETNNYTDWTCSVSASDYDYPIRTSMTIGRTGSVSDDTPFLAYSQLPPSNNNNIYVQSISYEATSTQDPNTQLLQQQIQQNETIIDQNETIIEQNQATQDYLTDDTPPEADTDNLPSVGLLPAGPLDSLLGLPLTLMTNISTAFGGTCEDLEIPLPYVDSDLPIPCFDTIFYTGAFAPLANIIGGASSAIILYYWLKHLYKKVDRAVSMETTDEDTWGVL